MDLKIFSYKSRLRVLDMLWVFLVLSLFSSFVESWRISQKCPHGHYFNDGCTACWCDIRTGHTRCEKVLKCARVPTHVKCPNGRRYKDTCGNDCTCYEASGTVLCNEKRKCRQNEPPKLHEPTSTPRPSFNNVFLRRSGILPTYIPPTEEHPMRLRLPGTTGPPPPQPSSSYTTFRSKNSNFYDNISIVSTPHPQVRIPTSGKSEELIIEPAIIIRKKGSNKASIVRNPNSATSVTLPSSRRRHDNDNTVIINKNINNKLLSGSYSYSSTKPPSLTPLHLYEKQLQTIMNIRRAYSQLLRSKVNFNFQIAAGKVPAAVTGIPSSTDHPRRFDSNYDNSTDLINSSPSPQMFVPSQHPTQLPDHVQMKPLQPLVMRKEIKNVLQQFSPVPPLKQFVSYVATSTENYLKDFLNRNRLQNAVHVLPSHETTLPPPPPQPEPQTTTPLPVSYPFSTIEPFQQHNGDPSTIPIHKVYQNHEFQMLTTTEPPLEQNYYGHNSYLHKTLNSQANQPSQVDQHEELDPKRDQFPFMTDLMREIARIDNVPSTSPKSISSMPVFPTFHTPGPPYAEIHEVQPLSFLPPPQPEPATPTRRTFTSQKEPLLTQPNPTVRVNLDKPIYVSPPPQQRLPPPHYTPQQWFQPQPQQHYHHTKHRFHPLRLPIIPNPNNRRIYSNPQRPNFYVPPPLQVQQQPRPYHPYQPIQHVHTHQVNQPSNTKYRPLFSQYFIPRPKQYRLVLKGNVRDAAVKVDDVVPRFVNKIAHEFFKKPEIYIPKIRPGKPLTLEKVVLNHKEIIPTEMTFSADAGAPSTKLRFTPQAQWEMREELAKQGIMLNEPLTAPVRDYIANDPNVMEMDAPVKGIQTFETHSSMGMGTLNDYPTPEGVSPAVNIPQIIQHAATVQQQQQQQLFNQFLPPTPSPITPQIASPPPELMHQHHQELQHQLLLAQEQQRQQNVESSSVKDFKIDPNDFNDFNHGGQHVFPQELQIPGVEKVIVDQYVIRDPLDPSAPVKMYSTTTVEPSSINTNADIPSIMTEHHRNGLAALPAHGPTPPPAVLVRHHGAPTHTPTPSPLPPQDPAMVHSLSTENFLVTIINSTPQPFITTTIAPLENSPSQISNTNMGAVEEQTEHTDIASQIQDFLANEMDFGARPEASLYDLLFHRRIGEVATDKSDEMQQEEDKGIMEEEEHEEDDQIATETKASSEIGIDAKVDTDKVANIFSIDYKNKYNKNPPPVIVIKVPPDHSDGPFPKVVEKRRGQGGKNEVSLTNSKNKSSSTSANTSVLDDDNQRTTTSPTDKSITVASTSQKPVTSSESSANENDESTSSKELSSSEKRRRERKRKRKERKRKKKNRNKNKDADNTSDKEDSKPELRTSEQNESKEVNQNSASNTETTTVKTETENVEKPKIENPEDKFQAELDWKSQLMANICDLNPSSPLCLTYRSICLLMTSED